MEPIPAYLANAAMFHFGGQSFEQLEAPQLDALATLLKANPQDGLLTAGNGRTQLADALERIEQRKPVLARRDAELAEVNAFRAKSCFERLNINPVTGLTPEGLDPAESLDRIYPELTAKSGAYAEPLRDAIADCNAFFALPVSIRAALAQTHVERDELRVERDELRVQHDELLLVTQGGGA